MMFFETGQYSQGLVPLTLTTSISGTTMYSLKVPNLASCFILFPLHVNRVVPSSISALSNPKLKHKKKKQQRYFFITHPMYGNKRQFWMLDCTYWIPDSRYWIPDCLSVALYSVFQLLVGFRFLELNSGLHKHKFPGLRMFTSKNFPSSGIRITFHGAT